MNREGRRLFWGFATAASISSLAWACTAPATTPAVGAASADPPDACALPTTLDSFEACRDYASCCGQSEEPRPSTCSYARANASAKCACALSDGHEVRCSETADGVTCECL
jgi:hypothetical protein